MCRDIDFTIDGRPLDFGEASPIAA